MKTHVHVHMGSPRRSSMDAPVPSAYGPGKNPASHRPNTFRHEGAHAMLTGRGWQLKKPGGLVYTHPQHRGSTIHVQRTPTQEERGHVSGPRPPKGPSTPENASWSHEIGRPVRAYPNDIRVGANGRGTSSLENHLDQFHRTGTSSYVTRQGEGSRRI